VRAEAFAADLRYGGHMRWATLILAVLICATGAYVASLRSVGSYVHWSAASVVLATAAVGLTGHWLTRVARPRRAISVTVGLVALLWGVGVAAANFFAWFVGHNLRTSL
jgi:hypothetical protein